MTQYKQCILLLVTSVTQSGDFEFYMGLRVFLVGFLLLGCGRPLRTVLKLLPFFSAVIVNGRNLKNTLKHGIETIANGQFGD